MMQILLRPSITLMRRMRLLPKFALVGVLLIAPLLLVSTLLMLELQRSIALANQERLGVQYLRATQDLTRLLQEHAGLRRMQLSGNASAQEEARRVQAQVDARMANMKTLGPLTEHFQLGSEWLKTEHAWATIRTRLTQANAKESDAQHAAALDAVHRLSELVADRSGLALDADAISRRLATVFTTFYPAVVEEIAKIAAHGAPYIDTGLMEPNADVMLSAAVMGARRDLERLPAQVEAIIGDQPQWRASLQAQAKAVPLALAFLDRAQDEVLNSVNQTSGNDFFAAARRSIDALYASADGSADLLDTLLAQRIARDSQHRNLMLGAVALALLTAAYLLTGFFVSFPQEVRRLQEAVARAASGELSHHLSSDGKDEIGGLCNAFGGMTRELERLIREVRAGSDAIAAASHHITVGNADLSTRTELQVKSVQHTAGSMEELTATVGQNADSAREASLMAAQAVDAAHGGSTVVREAVETMQTLQAGSRRILEITSVIDKIAFQTNLLALNAAVEAARAGVHGRGFAVVAGEVRTLSQVSAESAKQIKELIEDSVQRIESGSALVHDAGTSMENIVANVQRMAVLMTRISEASTEQSARIEHVNTAVAQIDKSTQDNLLLVEGATTASRTLQAQAQRLTAAVAAFRLGETTSPQTSPAVVALSSRQRTKAPMVAMEARACL